MMFIAVVAIGRSLRATDAYPDASEGMPIALTPTPRRKRLAASTVTTRPCWAKKTSGSVPARAKSAPHAASLRMPNRCVRRPMKG